MRIIHCAPFNIFTKTGGALYANPVKISLGLQQNGCFVHNFDYRDTARYFSLFRNKKNGAKKMNQHLMKLVDEIAPDIVIFGHAELIETEVFEYLKKKNIKIMYWYNDVPLQESFKKIAHYFDIILTTAGGEFIDDIKKYNSNTHFLPNLVDQSIEKYIGYKNKAFKSDLIFSGRADQERKLLLDYLNNNLDISIKKKYIGDTKQSVVIGDEYLKALADSKISINHNRDFTLKYEWYSSDRLVHILANGSFALSTGIINGEDFFEDKLEYYSTNEELVSKINYFLENDEERLSKAKWLRKRVFELFNAKRVTKYMLSLYNQDIKDLNTYEWYK